MTEGSIERLFCYLARIDRKDSPASFAVSTPQKNVGRSVAKPSSESPSPESQVNTFIDIGSGYGKVVFHAKLGGRYSHSVGIEYVESRASLAAVRGRKLPALVRGPTGFPGAACVLLY